jgi:hypothetical protein
MIWVQFWLLTAAIYDAAYRVKNGGKHFIVTISVCLLLALGCWLKGVL